jgi:hypothetical protein
MMDARIEIFEDHYEFKGSKGIDVVYSIAGIEVFREPSYGKITEVIVANRFRKLFNLTRGTGLLK